MPKGQTAKAEHWLTLIDEWKQSNLNKKAFCVNKAISYKNFTKWYSRLVSPRKMGPKRATSSPSAVPSLFLPVEIKAAEQHMLPAKPLILILSKQLQLQIPLESINGPFLTTLFKSLGVLSC